MKCWLVIVSLLLIGIPVPALAQDSIRIEVDPDDQDLGFRGFVGENDVLTDNLQLTATGEVDQFVFVTHELKSEDGEQEIQRSQVELVGERTLPNGIPKVFQVSVTGVKVPGTYTGRAEIVPAGRVNFEPRVVNLKVVAKARPNVTLEPEDFRLDVDLVTCREGVLRGLDCAFAKALLGDDVLQTGYPLKLNNKTPSTVQVSSTELVVMGEEGNKPMTSEELSLPENQTLPASQIDTMHLTFHRAAMTPGHYSGYINMTMVDGLEPFKVPVDVMVRTGPVWATLALLGGVVAGQVGRILEERKRDPAKGVRELFLGEGGWLERTIKVISIIGAVVAGLIVVYAGETGSTFFANPVKDILAIGAWGFAADLSSRGFIKYVRG